MSDGRGKKSPPTEITIIISRYTRGYFIHELILNLVSNANLYQNTSEAASQITIINIPIFPRAKQLVERSQNKG